MKVMYCLSSRRSFCRYSSVAPSFHGRHNFGRSLECEWSRRFIIPKIWGLALNAKRLLFKEKTRVGFLFKVRVRLPRFWLAFWVFLFRENRSPSSTLFGLIFEAPSDLHLQKFPSKVSSLCTFMVGFYFHSQECPSVSFFFARSGVFL